MPPYRKLVINCNVVTAGKKRKCYHSKDHSILKGDLLLKIEEDDHGYCKECALRMLEIAKNRIIYLEEQLTT